MERKFGPSRFERLGQGSEARARMIEASRKALAQPLAEQQLQLGVVEKGEIRASQPWRLVRMAPPRLRRFAYGAVASGTTLAAACSGGAGSGENPQQQEPNDGFEEPGGGSGPSPGEQLEETQPFDFEPNPNGFLELPFPGNPQMQIQQGWIASSGSEHKGTDFIMGEIDRSMTWQSFAVLAAADGEACANPSHRQGSAVFIEHQVNRKTFYTYLGHLDEIAEGIPPCDSGSRVFVEQGQLIGTAGSTGVTDPEGRPQPRLVHLHFQVNDAHGNPVDPYDLRATRDRYPDPNFTNSNICGPNHLWVFCPVVIVRGHRVERAQQESGVAAWPMFRGNPEHTSRSPYFGLEQPGESREILILEGIVFMNPVIIGYDGTIYAGEIDNSALFAFNPDGSLKWRFPAEQIDFPFEQMAPPAIAKDGTVYLAAGGRGVLCEPNCKPGSGLFAIGTDGKVEWIFAQGRMGEVSSPTVDRDGTIYLVADGILYTVNPDGTLRWVFADRDLELVSAPTVWKDGTIYVTSYAYNTPIVLAINPDGSLKWQFDVPAGGPPTTVALGPDGELYVGVGGLLFALDSEGNKRWQWTSPGAPADLSAPAISVDGTIYVGGDQLYAMGRDGSVKWVFDAGDLAEFCPGRFGCSEVSYSTPVVDAGGTVYVNVAISRAETLLIAVNLDGTKKWAVVVDRLNNLHTDFVTQPAIATDGKIFAGAHGLYAISER